MLEYSIIGSSMKKFFKPVIPSSQYSSTPYLNDSMINIDQLCHLLLDLGVQKGDRVSVLLYNGHPYLEIFFALSKIGAILVPFTRKFAGPEVSKTVKDKIENFILKEENGKHPIPSTK
jgi:acyl-coenzyme A synthetase/AMP-(fatty) acid ligase